MAYDLSCVKQILHRTLLPIKNFKRSVKM